MIKKSERKTCRNAITGLLIPLLLLLPGLTMAQQKTVEVRDLPSIIIELTGQDKCHTQGADLWEDYLFITCVDRNDSRAWLYRYSLPEDFPSKGATLLDPETLDVTDKGRYHPSGIDHDEDCLWQASAHYRSVLARSTVMCINKETLETESSFNVKDHIGGVTIMGDKIVGLNWDSKKIYRFDKEGNELSKDDNPTGVAYQDCDGIDEKSMLCSGNDKVAGEKTPVVDRLFYDSDKEMWSLKERAFFIYGAVPLGREGFTRTAGEDWIFVPEDYPKARLYLYPSPF